jgi:opacity protein-like surface antigen
MKLSASPLLLVFALLAYAAASSARAEVLVDFGVSSTHVEADIATYTSIVTTTTSGYHVGAGVRRALKRGSIGARLELEDIDSNLLIAVRALDYKHAFTDKLSIGGFLGAARLDLATPAYGYWLGGAVEYDFSPHWAVSFDLTIGDKLARDNLLPTDPQGGRPDNFYNLRGLSIYLSRRF